MNFICLSCKGIIKGSTYFEYTLSINVWLHLQNPANSKAIKYCRCFTSCWLKGVIYPCLNWTFCLSTKHTVSNAKESGSIFREYTHRFFLCTSLLVVYSHVVGNRISVVNRTKANLKAYLRHQHCQPITSQSTSLCHCLSWDLSAVRSARSAFFHMTPCTIFCICPHRSFYLAHETLIQDTVWRHCKFWKVNATAAFISRLLCVCFRRGAGYRGMHPSPATNLQLLSSSSAILVDPAELATPLLSRVPGLSGKPAQRPRACRDLQPSTLQISAHQVHAHSDTFYIATGSNMLTFPSPPQLWAQPWSTHQNNWSPGDQWMEWQSGSSR